MMNPGTEGNEKRMMVFHHATDRLRRLVLHFKTRTVGERLAWETEKWKSWLKMSPEQRRAERMRLRWVRAGAEAGYADARVEGGARLRLYTENALSGSIFRRMFEQNEQAFLWRYLRPRDVFVDAGANIGLFTVIAAKRVGSMGKVYAFEPVELPRKRLEENIHLNQFDNVSIQPLALSDQADWLEISVPMDGHDAWSSLGAPISGGDIKTNRIEAITWDTFANREGITSLTMMKIDVEGWESRVLEGASVMLSVVDAPLLQVEFTDAAAQAAGSSCAALYQQLLDFGYTVCRYDRERNRLIPDGFRPSYPYDNLYATKHLDPDNLRLAGSIESFSLLKKLKHVWPTSAKKSAAERT